MSQHYIYSGKNSEEFGLMVTQISQLKNLEMEIPIDAFISSHLRCRECLDYLWNVRDKVLFHNKQQRKEMYNYEKVSFRFQTSND